MTLTEIKDLIRQTIQYYKNDSRDVRAVRETLLTLADNSVKSYKEISGFLSQDGTDLPTLDIVVNDFDEAPVFARYGLGLYGITITGAFTADKTIFPSPITTIRSGGLNQGFSTVTMSTATTDVVTISSFQHISNGATNIVLNPAADAQVNRLPFSIKVYN